MIDRMKKLRAMADQGTENERETARRMLDKLMAEHGVTEADLDKQTGETSPKWFKYTTKPEKSLLFQIVAKFTQDRDVVNGTRTDSPSEHGFELTDSEYVQIEYSYEVMRKLLQRHMEESYMAFVCANDLTVGERKASDLSPEEREKYSRAYGMAQHALKHNGPAIPLTGIGN